MRDLCDIEKKIGGVASHGNLRESVEFSQEIATIKNQLSSFEDSSYVISPIENWW